MKNGDWTVSGKYIFSHYSIINSSVPLFTESTWVSVIIYSIVEEISGMLVFSGNNGFKPVISSYFSYIVKENIWKTWNQTKMLQNELK